MLARTRFRHPGLLVLVILASLGTAPAFGQEFGEIAGELRRNFDSLRGYTWKSRVEFLMDGKPTSTQVFQVSVDAEGKLRRELLETQGKMTKEQDSARHSLTAIRNQIDAFTHMSPESLKAAFGENPRFVEAGDDGKPTLVQAHDVISRGDTLQIWVDPGSHRILTLHLEAELPGSPVRLEADFEQSDDGPNHVSKSTLYTRFKKKALTLITTSSDLQYAN